VALSILRLTENETIAIGGCEKVGQTQGYGLDLKFIRPITTENTRNRLILAMDAKNFEDGAEWWPGIERARLLAQLDRPNLLRELNKAFQAFTLGKELRGDLGEVGISTGHWGCGAFGADKFLKAIIQIIAASMAKITRLNYFAFGVRQWNFFYKIKAVGCAGSADALDIIPPFSGPGLL